MSFVSHGWSAIAWAWSAMGAYRRERDAMGAVVAACVRQGR